jgi:two-component sensor histidine kinase
MNFSNAFKHAFPEERKGKIGVPLAPTAEGEIELGVDDNGIDLPKGFEVGKADSIGLLL